MAGTRCFALLLVALCAPAVHAATETWMVKVQGTPAGAMTVDRGDDGVVRVDYSFRDNGRGPDMKEEFTVDAAQRPTRYQVRGKATMGGELREDFNHAEGRIRWTSTADSGDEPAPEGNLFVPLQSSPAYYGQLLRALLARPERSAPVGAASVLTAEKLVAVQLDGPAGPVPVALYAVTGGGSAPWYLWLRDDGSLGYFGLAWPGWQLPPAGHEWNAALLIEKQRTAQQERLRAIRQRTAQPLPGLTVVQNVRWFDARAATMRGPADVYLFDGRIGAITAPGAVDAQPQQRIDGSGRTLLPGLIDMHAHMWPDAGLLHLAGGVTTVRDLANHNDDLMLLKRRIDSGEFAGPHIVPAGLIEGQSPFSLRRGVVAADLDAALRAVDGYAARGYRQIKLYNSIKPEWVKPLTARAHQHGMTVAGHVPAFMRAEEAVAAGFDELTHINQLMLNFFVKPDQDTRTLLRFTLVGDEARRVGIDSPAARRFIALLRRHGTAVDPTLATFEAMFTQRDGELNPALGDVADHLPVLWRRGLRQSEMSPGAGQVLRYRASWARMVAFTGALHRAGVPLVAGTDDTPGLMLHRELKLYVQAGIAPLEVLRIATWNGARVAGITDRAGSIERGKPADLVLVDGDPGRDIGELRKASLVIQGGQAYAPAALYQAAGFRPFVPGAKIEAAAAAAAK